MLAGAMLAAATLVSEDAATLAGGAMVAARSMSAGAAILWLTLGIWVGDLALFGLGRLARRFAPAARWVNRRWSHDQIRSVESRVERSAAMAIVASRFLPGTRVLLYVASGILHVRPLTFALSAAAAALVWTSSVVTAVGSIGAWW
jgi:membrane protein DedA with SNARE-associated domain